MQDTLPLTRDLVLVGGGHTHALVLRKWAMRPLPGARLTLIDPAPTAAYSGMLPGFVAGHYSRDDLDIDLVRLARLAGARLILGAVTGADLGSGHLHVAGRPPVAFDVASFDVGITSAMPGLPGFAAHGVPAKPLTPFAARWETFRGGDGPARVAVIGGGVAGAELSMAMAHALRGAGREAAVTLLDRSRALTEATEDGRVKLLTVLENMRVDVIQDADVVAVERDGVALDDGRRIASDFTVGAAGAHPHGWMVDLGLALHDGFLAVDATLRTSDPRIFACGDCAHMTHAPRPKAGVYAVRQAPVLYDNLVAALSGGEVRNYSPQKDYLKLVSLGGKSALAEKWGRAVAGSLLWRWKDRIDRKFMRQFSDLRGMDPAPLPALRAEGAVEGPPMCGGCGAKVGRGALREVLSGASGDDAAVLEIGGQKQVVTVDHLRAVTDDPALMTRIAAVHALGDVWAMGAMPQAMLATLILPRMSPELQRRTLAEIMAVAEEIATDSGAYIVGGHTSMGSEMTIGFTVTGLCARAPITLAGARAGDALILTKPLGSGVILAAEMRGLARGDVVAGAYDVMVRGQGAASKILCDAKAMTDVTGFGLAGHLAGMCAASGVAAEIVLDDVPLMGGALELAKAGVGSTLLADNVAGAGNVVGARGARGELMFDPQTAGGLLAAVDAGAADGIVELLQEAGYPAAIIGRIVDGGAEVRFL